MARDSVTLEPLAEETESPNPTFESFRPKHMSNIPTPNAYTVMPGSTPPSSEPRLGQLARQLLLPAHLYVPDSTGTCKFENLKMHVMCDCQVHDLKHPCAHLVGKQSAGRYNSMHT